MKENIPFEVFLVTFFILSWSGYTLKQTTICVLPDNSLESAENDSEYSIPVYCDGSFILSNFSQIESERLIKSDTAVTFLNGIYKLSFQWEFTNLKNITLTKADPASSVNIRCSNSSGIVFQNITNLEVTGLAFKQCSAPLTQGDGIPRLAKNILSSLAFLYGENLRVMDVDIENTTTGVCIFDVSGIVDIKSVHVRDAFSLEKDTQGGNVIAYSSEKQDVETVLTIEMSSFSHSGYGETLSCSITHNRISFSSGLALVLNAAKLKVYILDTHFHNNHGCNGGNLLLLLNNRIEASQEPSVTLHNVTFENGRALIGGGLYISFEKYFSKTFDTLDYRQPPSFSAAFYISNCTFRNNYALMSGGGIYLEWEESHILHKTYDANITDSNFVGNVIGINGSGGLAIHCKTYVESQDRPHQLGRFRVNFYVKHCNFSSHTSERTNERLRSESSVILAKSVPYLRLNGIHVTSNNCTAILAIGTVLLFYGSSVISENNALSGAGIRLCSGSVMYFFPHTNLAITDNTAETTGGGILVNSKCLTNIPMCFYQFTHDVQKSLLNTINITVKNNHANIAGSNLFGGSIDYCYLLDVNHSNKSFKNRLNIPKNNATDLSSMSSNPQQVCFVKDGGYKCEKSTEAYIYPGQVISLNVRVVGQLNGSVPGIVKAYYNESLVLCNSDSTKQVTNLTGENINYTILSSTPKISKQPVSLHLRVGSDSIVHEYARNFPAATVSIYLLDCPLGFSMQQKDNRSKKAGYVCKCFEDYFHFIRTCTLKSKYTDSTITKHRYAWIGTREFDNVTFFTSTRYCPLDYCDLERMEVPISSDNKHLQNVQCLNNRTGTICGSCSKGWSLMLGNSKCSEDCSNMSLLLMIPFALAGLLLVFAISFFDLTVTMGTVNSFIFYANVMKDNYIHILAAYPIPVLTPILRIFLAWFNLDLGIPFCFYRGMGAMGKILFQVAFPVYLWLIALVIIILSNKYVRVTRLVGKNAVKVLATLILLSYYKMLSVTIGSLNYYDLHVYNMTGHVNIEKKWIMDGNIDYFDPSSHMILAIMAVLFIVVSLPFTLSLLFIKHIFALSNYCECFSFINKLKPFFDVYTGPFKDNARFWPGLLLLARVAILVAQVEFSKFLVFYYVTILVCLILSVIMVVLKGVYKEHFLNVIEYSSIFNIAIVFTLMTASENAKSDLIQGINHASILVVFITFLGIMLYHINLKYSCCQLLQVRFKRGCLQRSCDFDVLSVEGMRGYERVDDVSIKDELVNENDKMIHFPPADDNTYGFSISVSASNV